MLYLHVFVSQDSFSYSREVHNHLLCSSFLSECFAGIYLLPAFVLITSRFFFYSLLIFGQLLHILYYFDGSCRLCRVLVFDFIVIFIEVFSPSSNCTSAEGPCVKISSHTLLQYQFFFISSWPYTEGGDKWEYCVIKNFFSQTFMGVQWRWCYIGVWLYC